MSSVSMIGGVWFAAQGDAAAALVAPAATVPAWFTAPLAAVTMAIVAAHLLHLRSATMPASRRRIRIANGAVMLVNIPLLAAGFTFVSSKTHPGVWALVWVAAIALLATSVGLAVLDAINTARLARAHHRRLHEEFRRNLHRDRDARRARADDAAPLRITPGPEDKPDA
jgi:hypothetical protein